MLFFLTFSFLPFSGNGQTINREQDFSLELIDSIKLIYDEIAIEKLSESEKALYDTNRSYISGSIDDSLRIDRILGIVGTSSEDTITEKLNRVAKWFCEEKKEASKSEKEQKIYLSFLATIYANEAYYAGRKGNYDEGIANRYKSLEIIEILKDTSKRITSLLNLGISHFNLIDINKAEELWRESLKLQLLVRDSSKLILTYNYLGICAIKGKDFDQANDFLSKSLVLSQKEKNFFEEAYTLGSLGNLYYEMGQYERSFDYLKKSLEKYDSIGNTDNISDILYSLTLVTEKLKKWKLNKAYSLRAYENAQKSGYPSLVETGARALYKVYKREGNYKKSLEMYELFITMDDSIRAKKNQEALFEQEYKFKYQQKAALDSLKNLSVINLQKLENKRRKTTANFLWICLGLALIFGVILWTRFSIIRKQKIIIENDKNKLDQANEKLKSLDELKSRFFTNISHEIRTPLTVIGGMAEQINQKPDKWVSRGTELIKQNTNQLLNLVNQILELRKLESGELKVNIVHNDIISYLRYITESFHSLVETKDIQLHYLPEVKECEMDYDPEKMIRIISNLLSNAIKFTPSGGNIYIQASQIEKSKKPFLLLKIRDTGVGIPSDKLASIFDRFYQVEGSSTRSGEGTGIGLALVKELIQLIGGQIEVSSELGEGTRFSVYLPITKKVERKEANNLSQQTEKVAANIVPQITENQPIWASKGYDSKNDRPTILVVEDNTDVIEYIVGCLEDLYQIEIAQNGQEGIEKALELVPDLIISDVMMPIKDGLEVCNTLKQDMRTSHIPIILLTARADIESRLSGLQKGADAYLTKPFNQEELLIRIKKLLEIRLTLQERYRSAKISEEAEVPVEAENLEIEDAFIQKIREAVEADLDNDNFKITDLCRAIGLSRSQLHNKVKALTGQSASYMVRQIRLQKATELIKNSELTIAEIAYEVGYRDPSYFSRNFMEEYGMTPTEMRK